MPRLIEPAPVAFRNLQVKSIAEMGAYVSLLEYNGIEGMILLSELSRRRIRSVSKLIKACSPAALALSFCTRREFLLLAPRSCQGAGSQTPPAIGCRYAARGSLPAAPVGTSLCTPFRQRGFR